MKTTEYEVRVLEIDIDTWPLIPTYMEIEGKNEQEIYSILEKLSIKQSEVVTLDVEGIFREIYGIDISDKPVLKFE